MKRLVLTVVATATVTLLGWVTPVQATPITYTEMATGTGVLDGTSFTQASVTITFLGDTSNVGDFVGCVGCLLNIAQSVTVNVSGVGSDTFKDPIGILGFPIPSPELGNMAGVGMVDDAANTSGLLILATLSNNLIGYGLSTSIGPISGGAATTDRSTVYSTTLGTFQWNPYPATSTFTATVSPTPVPEPATLTLTALGLAGVMTRYRRRRSAS